MEVSACGMSLVAQPVAATLRNLFSGFLSVLLASALPSCNAATQPQHKASQHINHNQLLVNREIVCHFERS